MDRCFKLFLRRFDILKEKVPTVEKKRLRLVLLFLGLYATISLRTRTNMQKSNKRIKKSLFPKFLHQLWFTSLSVDNATNAITENVLDILL